MEEIKLNENYEKFPDNFFVPKEVKYGDHSFRNFLVRFDNLYEIYRYLNSKPVINKNPILPITIPTIPPVDKLPSTSFSVIFSHKLPLLK